MLDEQNKKERLAHLKSVARHRKPAAAKIPSSPTSPKADTINISFNLDDVPPSPTQYAEFTLTPRSKRKFLRRHGTQRRVAEITCRYDLERKSEGLTLIKHQSLRRSALLSSEMPPSRSSLLGQISATDTIDYSSISSFDILDQTTIKKYSHIERMAVVRKFYK